MTRKYTLITDGPSDRILLNVLDWLLRQQSREHEYRGQWFDPRQLPRTPSSLAERIRLGLELFPCDLLFVHRDAERPGSFDERRAEIDKALANLGAVPVVRKVAVVPVRMTEAWFLFDEAALRRAAGNPNGRATLTLPPLSDIEFIDAKAIGRKLLQEASGLTGRRLRRLNLGASMARIADLIEDFSPLRKLAAFAKLEKSVTEMA